MSLWGAEGRVTEAEHSLVVSATIVHHVHKVVLTATNQFPVEFSDLILYFQQRTQRHWQHITRLCCGKRSWGAPCSQPYISSSTCFFSRLLFFSSFPLRTCNSRPWFRIWRAANHHSTTKYVARLGFNLNINPTLTSRSACRKTSRFIEPLGTRK